MRCARIKDGLVVNVELGDPADDPALVATDTAQIGDAYADGTFTPAPPATQTNQTTGLDFLTFMALFSDAEQTAISGSNDAHVRRFLLMATGAEQIDLTDARVIGGVNYLANLKLIDPGRVAVILAGSPPT